MRCHKRIAHPLGKCPGAQEFVAQGWQFRPAEVGWLVNQARRGQRLLYGAGRVIRPGLAPGADRILQGRPLKALPPTAT